MIRRLRGSGRISLSRCCEMRRSSAMTLGKIGIGRPRGTSTTALRDTGRWGRSRVTSSESPALPGSHRCGESGTPTVPGSRPDGRAQAPIDCDRWADPVRLSRGRRSGGSRRRPTNLIHRSARPRGRLERSQQLNCDPAHRRVLRRRIGDALSLDGPRCLHSRAIGANEAFGECGLLPRMP